jgi:hypothetical protein
MRRAVATVALVVLGAGLASSAADGRRHRLRLPAADLPHGLTVDESEWAMRPSKTLVAAGIVRLRVYNRGEDDHDVLVTERGGTQYRVPLKPGEAGTIDARLSPGTYRIICSLFAGTPDSHEDKGMAFTLRVR